MSHMKTRTILEKRQKSELIDLLLRICKHYPNVENFISEEEKLSSGKIDEIVLSVQREIDRVSSEQAWSHSWSDEGYTPDYSGVKQRLEQLLEAGHADEVLSLGDYLMQQTALQLDEAQDEGELSCEISDCMEVALDALRKSSWERRDKILWLIDVTESDDYGVVEDFDKLLDSLDCHEEDWRGVAEVYEKRLASEKCENRAKAVSWLIFACDLSEQSKQIIPLLEREVEKTGLYLRLVDALLQEGERERARTYAVRGCKKLRDKRWHDYDQLKDRLLQLAVHEKRFDVAASYLAEKFMYSPSKEAFSGLLTVAEKAGLREEVRTAALCYLWTGKAGNWHLPPTDIAQIQNTNRNAFRFPYYAILVDLAILERRMDDVVSLHEEFLKKTKTILDTSISRKVAAAVAETHPDVSLEIWRQEVGALIAQVKPAAYQEAAPLLRAMQSTYNKTSRNEEWDAFFANLRVIHRQKRRLMGVLDSL